MTNLISSGQATLERFFRAVGFPLRFLLAVLAVQGAALIAVGGALIGALSFEQAAGYLRWVWTFSRRFVVVGIHQRRTRYPVPKGFERPGEWGEPI